MSTQKRQRTESTAKASHEAARRKWLTGMTKKDDLQIVERLLRESIHPRSTDSNDDKELELERRQSYDALCLLLCQQGRDDEATTIMRQLGHVARLSKQVLHYATPHATPQATPSATTFDPTCTPLRVFDNALRPDTLSRLQATFCAADAPYWTSHNYSVYPPSPYFSFVVPLTPDALQNLGPLGDLLSVIVKKTEEHFGGSEEARFAELWAHRRPHASGHQLHFDSDDEGRGGVRNPLVSTVLYLSEEGCGGPTLVTDQHIDGEDLAQTGWLAFPKKNRLVIFDGAVLHGVIPGRGYVDSTKTRTTLMVALWDDIRVRSGDGPGAARPLPMVSTSSAEEGEKNGEKNGEENGGENGGEKGGESSPEWCQSLTSPSAATEKTSEVSDDAAVVVNPVQVDQVWTDLLGNNIGHSKPHYDKVFQGF